MTSPSCPFCGLVAAARSSFCGRCGGPLAAPGSVARVLATLSRAGTLVRNGVWPLARQVLSEALQTVGDAEALARARVRPLLGIVWDVTGALAAPPDRDIADLLAVAREALAALPADLFRGLRHRVDRLSALRQELENEERQRTDKEAAEPSTRRWFDDVTGRLQLDPAEALRLAYATPWAWPTVARDLDPPAFARAEPALALARAEQVLARGDAATAAALFEAHLAANPRTLRALEGLGRARAQLGDRAAAVRLYRRAVAHGTRNPAAYNDLARSLIVPADAVGDALDEARSAAQRAVDLAPIAAFWDTLAAVLLRLGDLPAAATAAREALLIAPEEAVCREQMKQIIEAFARRSSPSDSDSAFELTLDDSSGESPPLEAEVSAPIEGDLFATDFEVPAREEESDFEAVALADADNTLGSSEFDLAPEDGEDASDDEDDSQIVAVVDEEEASDADEDRARTGAAPSAAQPAAWVLPAMGILGRLRDLFGKKEHRPEDGAFGEATTCARDAAAPDR